MWHPGPRVSPAQYSISRILAIWAVASVPMGILGWVVAPLMSRGAQHPGFVRLSTLTVGLIWQFCLVLLLMRKETGSFNWQEFGNLLWLRKPIGPVTNKSNGWLWFWLIPLIAITAIFEIKVSGLVDKQWLSIVPMFAEPPSYSLASYLSSTSGKAEMVGAWGTLCLFLLSAVFNTFLGEELLFRGLLLPRMKGVFGHWAWAANGVLFGLYHIHQPWGILSGIISGALLFALPTATFRSSWLGIVLHSGQSVFFALIMLGMVLGIA